MIKLIIFDFDGTLVESAPGIWATANTMAKKFGLKPVSKKIVETTVGTGLDNFLEGIFPEQTKELGVTEMIRLYRSIYDIKYKHGLKIFKGVRETLKKLSEKGIILAIVSNKLSRYVNGINEELGIDIYFKDVLGSENVKKMKPDPYPLNLLMKKYKVKRTETLMVGDSQYDVEARKRAKCPVYFLKYGYADMKAVKKLKPEFISSKFSGLIKVIEGVK